MKNYMLNCLTKIIYKLIKSVASRLLDIYLDKVEDIDHG